MIPDAKSKQFVLYDDEWDTSKEYKGVPLYSKDMVKPGAGNKMGYTTRDWYFLSPEDAKKVFTGEDQLKPFEEDLSGNNATAMQLNDWRKALESSQDWKWSDAVATMGAGAAGNDPCTAGSEPGPQDSEKDKIGAEGGAVKVHQWTKTWR